MFTIPPRSKGKIKGCLAIRDMYKHYLFLNIETPKEELIDYKLFAKITKECNKELINQIVNHSEILVNLLQSILVGGTKLSKVIRDKWKLRKDESTGEYDFGPQTAYFAIDIYAFWELKPDSCDEDFCADIENPLKKCSIEIIESS